MTRYRNYLAVLPILVASVFISHGLQMFLDDVSAVMVYMLAIVSTAFFLDLGPAIVTCLFSVTLFDYFNLPPYMSFSRSPLEYIFTLSVMLVTASVISRLAKRLRRQVQQARNREERAAAMYALSADLAAARTDEDIVNLTVSHVAQALHGKVELHSAAVGIPAAAAPLPFAAGSDSPEPLSGYLRIGAGKAMRLDVLPDTPSAAENVLRRQLQAMLEQASLAMERNALRRQVREVELKDQEQSLRNNILNAISHDLRTPLASIIGASSSLLEQGDRYSTENRLEMHRIIHEEARHMQGMVENLLDMARIQSASFRYNQDWQALEEIVAGAMTILRRRIQGHQLQVKVPDDLPLIRCDAFLLERVIVNLVENAAKYSPEGTVIILEAMLNGEFLVIRVSDQGRGIPAGQLQHIFEPFYRLDPDSSPGMGLGLTICRNIVEAYGGCIDIESEPGSGTRVRVRLPVPAGQDTPGEPASPPDGDIS